jgi:hypothetical protein
MDAGDLAHALADIGMAAFYDLVEEFFRNEMGVGVDAHEVLRNCFFILYGLNELVRRNDVE